MRGASEADVIKENALEIAVSTDPGVIRSHNEDAVFADARLGLAILADGMGGYNAGEVASGMATTRLATDLGQPDCLVSLAGSGTAGVIRQPSSATS